MVRLQTQILWLVLFLACPNSMVSAQTESDSKTQMDRSAFDRALATVRKSYPNGDLPDYLYDETSGALISVVWPKNRFFFIVSPNEFNRECSLIPLTKKQLEQVGLDVEVLESAKEMLERLPRGFGAPPAVTLRAGTRLTQAELEQQLKVKLQAYESGPAPLVTRDNHIDWDELAQGGHYPIEWLRKDKRINLRNALKRNDTYMRCKNSGCVLSLWQKNNQFRVLVLPDPTADKFEFESITAEQLKDLDIDVDAISALVSGGGRMGMGMEGSAFELSFRITAHRSKEGMGAIKE